ncbi:MAG TPA: MFS transporter, partial [Spirochaetota bacterium]|nr:MFS transporter [Spirochaetota bacterium]
MFKKKEYFGIFILTCLLNFTFFSSSASLGLIPPYLSSLGATKTYIGFFMNLASLEIVLFVLIFGKYLHYIKRKDAFIFGTIVSIITFLGMYFFYKDLKILMLLRIFNAIPFVFCFSMHVSIIFDIVHKEKRLSSLAIFGISGILSNPVGSFLSEKFSFHFGPQSLFLLSLFFIAVYAILLIFLKDPGSEFHKKEGKSFFEIIKRKEIINIILFAIVFGGAFSVYASFIPNLSKEKLKVALLSAYFIPFAITTLMMRLFLSRFLDRVNQGLLILISYFFIFVSSLLILFLNSITILIIVGICYGVGHSILYPTVGTMFVNSGKPEEKEILNNSFV